MPSTFGLSIAAALTWSRSKFTPSTIRKKLRVEAPLLEMRKVKSSGGHETLRPVIETEIELMGLRWPIELTLASRDEMGFRMLLGRQAIRSRFLVHPGRSFFGGKPKKKKKKIQGKKSPRLRTGKTGERV